MVATTKVGFDFSLERIYETYLKKILTGEIGVRRFFKSGIGSS